VFFIFYFFTLTVEIVFFFRPPRHLLIGPKKKTESFRPLSIPQRLPEGPLKNSVAAAQLFNKTNVEKRLGAFAELRKATISLSRSFFG
jgi:hypothetical protein